MHTLLILLVFSSECESSEHLVLFFGPQYSGRFCQDLASAVDPFWQAGICVRLLSSWMLLWRCHPSTQSTCFTSTLYSWAGLMLVNCYSKHGLQSCQVRQLRSTSMDLSVVLLLLVHYQSLHCESSLTSSLALHPLLLCDLGLYASASFPPEVVQSKALGLWRCCLSWIFLV